MSNPVLIEVTRGPVVESRHRGSFAVCDVHGTLVASAGDIGRPVFPRSAIKALQALALVEGGMADELELTDAELALTCASHGGEPIHVATARSILAKAGRSEADLECGAHWPSNRAASRALAEGGTPSAVHNNCSGKHSGFVCLACGIGAEVTGYVRAAHPVQQTVKGVLSEVYGCDLDEPPGIDGCSIPTYAVPLQELASGFARFATGARFGPKRAAAAARLRNAVAANPVLVASHGAVDTRIAERFGTRVFAKGGAEGVFCASFPDLGLGLALKCDDGAPRGSEALSLGLLARIMRWSDDDRAAFTDILDPVLRNWNGIAVGQIRTAAPAQALPF